MSSKKVSHKNYFQKYFVTTENNRNLRIYESKLARKQKKIEKLIKKILNICNLKQLDRETLMSAQ